jgi:hypothetical protein|tara:strand:- start:164 stop:463 length:300 start_codon:yes stop_codon:yes gene_type:complete
MSRFPDVGVQIDQWARDLVDVSQNDSDEQNRRIRILDGKTTKAYTSGERDNLVNPNVGAIIFNSSLGLFQGYDGDGWLNIYERPVASNTLRRTVGGRSL